MKKDPTTHFVKDINKTINTCSKLIDEKEKYKYKQIKAKAPKFNAVIKIQKEGMPGRPLVNYKTAPGYRIAKKLHNIIKNSIKIEEQHNYSIINNTQFVKKVQNIYIKSSYKLVTLDIKSMYTNIPVQETIEILNTSLKE